MSERADRREAREWIERLGLQPHPEGGYFAETYRSGERIESSGLPNRYEGARAIATSIYFLLPGDQVSTFHRLRSDELWHWHTGSGLSIHLLREDGALETIAVGPNIDAGERFQALLPRETWFAARVHDPTSYALVGCTVAPGFDFADFELAEREALQSRFPQHAALIAELTRPSREPGSTAQNRT